MVFRGAPVPVNVMDCQECDVPEKKDQWQVRPAEAFYFFFLQSPASWRLTDLPILSLHGAKGFPRASFVMNSVS